MLVKYEPGGIQVEDETGNMFFSFEELREGTKVGQFTFSVVDDGPGEPPRVVVELTGGRLSLCPRGAVQAYIPPGFRFGRNSET